MKLIVGLGNPGKKYEQTRHNIGFLATAQFQKDNLLKTFRSAPRFNALMSEGFVGRKKIILLQPQTYMNNSGWSVAAAAKYFKIKPDDVWVVHDELDIDFGRIKISRASGPAGHNGIRSIIQHLGTNSFLRFRIGIKNAQADKMASENFVLKNFTASEKKEISAIISKCNAAIIKALNEGIEAAMEVTNRKEA